MQEVSSFYDREDPQVESYNFTYYEDLFQKANDSATLVNVLAKSYRHVTLCGRSSLALWSSPLTCPPVQLQPWRVRAQASVQRRE